MNSIFKYEVGNTPIWIPNGATIIHAGLDPAENPCIWALVDSEAEKIERDIRIIGTGWELTDRIVHIGSFVSGPFVWHVCEVIGEIE